MWVNINTQIMLVLGIEVKEASKFHLEVLGAVGRTTDSVKQLIP